MCEIFFGVFSVSFLFVFWVLTVFLVVTVGLFDAV